MKGFRGSRYQRIQGSISILLLFSLVLFGCTDLKSIRKFSEISAESANFTTLTEDFITSVDRQKRYEDEKYYEKLDEISKKREALRPGLTALPKIIFEYMIKLGAAIVTKDPGMIVSAISDVLRVATAEG